MAELGDARRAYDKAMREQQEFSKAFIAGFKNDRKSEYRKHRGVLIGDMTQSVTEQIEAFLERFPEEEFGCGHIVLSDKNLDDGAIQFCIERGKRLLAGDAEIVANFDYSVEGTQAAIDFLESLLAIPEEERGPYFDE